MRHGGLAIPVKPCNMPPMISPCACLVADAILRRGDLTGFTFLLSTLAMFGAAVFFLFERAQVSDAWKTSLLLAALVTLVAGINYALMSATWLIGGASPMEFRYLDWFITVPLICLQFYLLLDASGARPGKGMLWRLVLSSWWMLGAGYVGQAVDPGETILWGAVSTLGYAVILFEISFGEARHLSRVGTDDRAKGTFDILFWFLMAGWGIYPLGYMMGPGNLFAGLGRVVNLDVIYNLGDAVNKIGFGLVVWSLAREGSRLKTERSPLPYAGGMTPEQPGI